MFRLRYLSYSRMCVATPFSDLWRGFVIGASSDILKIPSNLSARCISLASEKKVLRRVSNRGLVKAKITKRVFFHCTSRPQRLPTLKTKDFPLNFHIVLHLKLYGNILGKIPGLQISAFSENEYLKMF